MMYSNIKNIILFFSLIVFVDFAGGYFLKKHFFNISSGTYGRINEGLKSDSKVLILGSSRAMHHYDPNILSKNLNISCYNSGLGGHGLFYEYAVLNERIKNNSPDIVILDLSPNILIDNRSYSKLNLFLPYYNKYQSFKEIIKLDPKFSNLELISNLYIYNSTGYDFIKNYLQKSIKNNNGYIPLQDQVNPNDFIPFFLQSEKIDKTKIDYLNKIISLCKKNNIKLIGVVSPTFIKFDRNNRIINKLDSIFKNHNIDFYNYSDFPKLYKKPIYFRDQLHMNRLGAEEFSKDISNKIN